MTEQIIHVDNFLNRITWDDTRFQAKYSIDPYINCSLSCRYCDSGYDPIIYVKNNAPEILRIELEQAKKGRMLIGTVHDPYQPAERTHHLTKRILEVIHDYGWPVHILTKTTSILDDLPLLMDFDDAIVTISISSTDPMVYSLFEPNVPSTDERLDAVTTLVDSGVKSGVSLMPIMPGINDLNLKNLIAAIGRSKARYLLHKHLELKGDQQQKFKEMIKIHYPELSSTYDEFYHGSYQPPDHYIIKLDSEIEKLCLLYSIAQNIPV